MAFDVLNNFKKTFAHTTIVRFLLLKAGIERHPGPSKKKLKCGSCKKFLGKSTRLRPLFYCTICGWVHFQCSGLANASEYDKNTFTCTKCKSERIVSSALTENADYRKAQKFYTRIGFPSSYGSEKADFFLVESFNCFLCNFLFNLQFCGLLKFFFLLREFSFNYMANCISGRPVFVGLS